jgi:hypothetical protein
LWGDEGDDVFISNGDGIRDNLYGGPGWDRAKLNNSPADELINGNRDSLDTYTDVEVL